MDINLAGQFWGIPFNLMGQMSDPPIWNNAVLAAALSAFLVSLANLWIDRRRNKKVINQRRQHTYSMLKARNAVIAEFYESYATAFIQFNIQRAVRHRTGIPSDPLYYADNERQMNRCDEFSKDVDIEYGKLLEILSLIPLIFSNKGQLIDNVERLNREFIKTKVQNLLDKYWPHIVEERINQLDPPISLRPGVIPSENRLSPSETQQQIDMENSLMGEVISEIKAEIETHIQDPVEALLAAMICEISSE